MKTLLHLGSVRQTDHSNC